MMRFTEKTEKKALVIRIIRSDQDLEKRLPQLDALLSVRESVEIVEELAWTGDESKRAGLDRFLNDMGEDDYVILYQQNREGEYAIPLRITVHEFRSRWMGLAKIEQL